MKLFVAGIPHDFDETDLKEMFELYGEVASVKIIIDRETGKSKGFGFIEMPNDIEAKETIHVLDGAGIKGKKMSVKEAEAQASGGGGFNRDRSRDNAPRSNNFNRSSGGGIDRERRPPRRY